MLGKSGVKVSFKGDKIVMTKNGIFVGKGYCSRKLFKLNVVVNENASFTYVVDSINLWYEGLGHVNCSYIKKMKELSLMSNLSLSNDKCEVRVDAKSTNKTCK